MTPEGLARERSFFYQEGAFEDAVEHGSQAKRREVGRRRRARTTVQGGVVAARLKEKNGKGRKRDQQAEDATNFIFVISLALSKICFNVKV